jgi:hypothetical protein
MFVSTPAGCAAGAAKCCARHDDAWGEQVRQLEAARSMAT